MELEKAEEQAMLKISNVGLLVKVIDNTTLEQAVQAKQGAQSLLKEIKDTFDPICDAANKAHKAATGARKKYTDPVDLFITSQSGEINRHLSKIEAERKAEEARVAREVEQERIRIENEARQAAEAERKRVEDEAKSFGASEAEAREAGATAAAAVEEEAKTEAATIITPPAMTQEAPKIAGLSIRTRKVAVVTNKKDLIIGIISGAIPDTVVDANMTMIQKLIDAGITVPGVTVEERVENATRKV